jgi:hypothetical protein
VEAEITTSEPCLPFEHTLQQIVNDSGCMKALSLSVIFLYYSYTDKNKLRYFTEEVSLLRTVSWAMLKILRNSEDTSHIL